MDGAHNFKRAGLGVIILDHEGNYFKYSTRINIQVTNNVLEYEATIFGVITLKKLRVNSIMLHSN